MDINHAVPCALIFNELFINAIRHAFPNNTDGRIMVAFHRIEEHRYELIVENNGIGFPPKDDGTPGYPDSFGMTNFRSLAAQIDGVLTTRNEGERSSRFSFRKTGIADSDPCVASRLNSSAMKNPICNVRASVL